MRVWKNQDSFIKNILFPLFKKLHKVLYAYLKVQEIQFSKKVVMLLSHV